MGIGRASYDECSRSSLVKPAPRNHVPLLKLRNASVVDLFLAQCAGLIGR